MASFVVRPFPSLTIREPNIRIPNQWISDITHVRIGVILEEEGKPHTQSNADREAAEEGRAPPAAYFASDKGSNRNHRKQSQDDRDEFREPQASSFDYGQTHYNTDQRQAQKRGPPQRVATTCFNVFRSIGQPCSVAQLLSVSRTRLSVPKTTA